MSTAVPARPSMVRSSLEEMLESLQRRDGEEAAASAEKWRDLPPALPARPSSRARLPSARRSLPSDIQIGRPDSQPAEEAVKRKHVSGSSSREVGSESKSNRFQSGSFGSSKKQKGVGVDPGELPYLMVSRDRAASEEACGSDLAAAAAAAAEAPPRSPQQNDKISYFINQKLSVWCWLPTGGWALGKIQSTSDNKASVLLGDGNVLSVPAEELFPSNPELLEGVDDLTKLSYLNEPSVLHNLQSRYSLDKIYSKAGPVLIAINPFKDVTIYGNDFSTSSRKKLRDSPHIYATAEAAYNAMLEDGVDQSIIISGESGAGKTETAKLAMQYLATLSGGSTGFEHSFIRMSCILEAFGNAKTSRNDNSSRFGKLIEIYFNNVGKICGAKFHTFLPEKSRVVQLADGERSYHIFYQLCAGGSSNLKAKLSLRAASDYKYLNQSKCLAINNVDDAHKFQMLVEALDLLRISKEDQEHAFEILAAVLWLGNVQFHIIDSEGHVEVIFDEAVTTAARLMGCSDQDLMLTLSTHKILIEKNSIAKKLTLCQAVEKRDSLAMFVYACLFYWLVEQVNKSIEVDRPFTGRSIAILDIYGFESFKHNSFEQFCINYANERLQQHFNRHLLKLVQKEYEFDGIEWTNVEFLDNQECLDLVEKKSLGLLSILDYESNIPEATDLTFGNKLKQYLNASPCFRSERDEAFTIQHYAGEVLYETKGFLAKNRDPLHNDCMQLLSSCSSKLPQLFAFSLLYRSQKSLSFSGEPSVGAKFMGQMFKLMQQLENTTPHFIHCIKPNNMKLPGICQPDLILQQLRCCRLFEVVRVSKFGYSTRITHQEFSRRYQFLLSKNNASKDSLSISAAILKQFNIYPDIYQVGFSKLYFRTGQIAAVEDKRKKVVQGITEVQKYFRGHKARQFFLELKRGVIALQSFVRGQIARKEYDLKKKQMNVQILLETVDEQQRAVILVQSVVRGQIARKEHDLKKKQMNVQILLETVDEQQRAVILVQSATRGWLTRRHFDYKKDKKNLNTEDENSKKNTDTKHVKVKVMPLAELQVRVQKAEEGLEQKEKENAMLREQLQQLETRWSQYEKKTKTLEETRNMQIASLQMSLAAARKHIASDNTVGHPLRLDTSPYRYNDSEDTSIGSRTPGSSTPFKFSNGVPDVGLGEAYYGSSNMVGHLLNEFDQQRRTFEDDAKCLVEFRSDNMNPDEEFRKLRHRFEAWKKAYKFQLRETKVKLHKLGHLEGDRSRRKWWEKFATKVTQY